MLYLLNRTTKKRILESIVTKISVNGPNCLFDTESRLDMLQALGIYRGLKEE